MIDLGHLLISKRTPPRPLLAPRQSSESVPSQPLPPALALNADDSILSARFQSQMSINESVADDEEYATPPESYTSDTDDVPDPDQFISASALGSATIPPEDVPPLLAAATPLLPVATVETEAAAASSEGQVVALSANERAATAAVARETVQEFEFALSDVQVLVGNAGDAWRDSLLALQATRLHLVEKFTISGSLKLAVDKRNSDLTEVEVAAQLPRLHIFVSDDKVLALASCFFLSEQLSSARSPAASTVVLRDRQYSPSTSLIHDAICVPSKGLYSTKLTVARLQIDAVAVHISSDVTGESLVTIEVSAMRGDWCQRPYDQSLHFTIGSFQIVDQQQKDDSPFRFLATTEISDTADDFVQIKFASFKPTPSRMVRIPSSRVCIAHIARAGRASLSRSVSQRRRISAALLVSVVG